MSKKQEVIHYGGGGRFTKGERVRLLSPHYAACVPTASLLDYDPAGVTCKRCLAFLRAWTKEGPRDPAAAGSEGR